MTKKALNMREYSQILNPLMSEVQNSNTNSTQQQQQQQQQSYSDSKINSAESERLYLEMKEAWL